MNYMSNIPQMGAYNNIGMNNNIPQFFSSNEYVSISTNATNSKQSTTK